MSMELKQVIIVGTLVMLAVFMIVMAIWARKLKRASGWGLLEQRYPVKDKFTGKWQVNNPLRLASVKGYHAIDVGIDCGYLYLRPTEHGEIVTKPVQIPWSAVESASIDGKYVELSVTADQKISIGLDCPGLEQSEHVMKLLAG
jgi:hypothetical protein